MSTSSQYRERLVRFYEYYAPEKVATVDIALEAYAGREEAMFRALLRKYGPEPAAPAPPAVAPPEADPVKYTATAVQEPIPPRPPEPARAEVPERPFVPPVTHVSSGTPHSAGPHKLTPSAWSAVTNDPGQYRGLLALAGASPSEVSALLSAFGPEREQFAGAVALLCRTIRRDRMMDISHDTLLFPYEYPKPVETMDELAFEYIVGYRRLFIHGWLDLTAVKSSETEEWNELMSSFQEGSAAIRYRKIVLTQAIMMITPIEDEHRNIITDDERLRFSGLLSWFRAKRDQVLLEAGRHAEEAAVAPVVEVELKWDKFKNILSEAHQVEATKEKKRSGGGTPTANRKKPVPMVFGTSTTPFRPSAPKTPSRASKPAPYVTPSKLARPHPATTPIGARAHIMASEPPQLLPGYRTSSASARASAEQRPQSNHPFATYRAKRACPSRGLFSQLLHAPTMGIA